MNTTNGVTYKLMKGALISLGTTGGDILGHFYAGLLEAGLSEEDLARMPLIHVDHSDPSVLARGLPAGCTIRTTYDKAHMEELSAAGELWDIPPALHSHDGITSQGIGAGNDPRRGKLAFKLHEQAFVQRLTNYIRRFMDHAAQRKQSDGVHQQKGQALTVVLFLSALGGTGSGALPRCLEMIRAVEDQLDVTIKIVVFVLVGGTIVNHNHAQGQKNQDELFKFLSAARLGLPCHPSMGDPAIIRRRLFDTLYLLSNVNNFGEISDWNACLKMLGQFCFQLVCMPTGEKLRESAIDTEGFVGLDVCGVPAWANTVGFSVIHLDRRRVRLYGSLGLAGNLLDALTTTERSGEIRHNTEKLLKALNLEESETSSFASDFVLHPEALSGANAAEQARTVVQNGVEGVRGVGRCDMLCERMDFVERQFAPRNLEPMIREQADKLWKSAWQATQQALEEFNQHLSGPVDRSVALENLRHSVDNFRAHNRHEWNGLVQSRAYLHQRIQMNREWLFDYRGRWWPIRLFKYFGLRRAVRELTEDVTQAVGTGVEITARKALDERTYTPIQDLLENLAAEAAEILSMLKEAKTSSDARANDLLLQPGTETAPVGIELVDAAYLRAVHPRTLANSGGPEELRSRLFSRFREMYPSVVDLAEVPAAEILERLSEAADAFFAGAVAQLKVMDAFLEKYPTSERQRTALLHCIRESQGRLRNAKGALGQKEKWIKILGVADAQGAELIKRNLAHLSETPGDWKTETTHDDECICFIQQRSDVSLSTEFRGGTNGQNLRELAAAGPDPVTALQPGLNPSKVDGERALIQAWATGVLQTGTDKGFVLLFHDEEPEHFDEPRQAAGAIMKDYRRLIRIHHGFAYAVAHEPEAVVEKVEQFRKTAGNGMPPELRAAVSAEVVESVAGQVKELCRYLRPPRR